MSEKLEKVALVMTSYLATVRKKNTDEWMRGAEECINTFLNFIGDDANVYYDGRDMLRTVAAPDRSERFSEAK